MAVLYLAGCGMNGTDHDHHHDQEHVHEDENSNIVHFSDEMQAKVDFQVGQVQREKIGQIIHTAGRIQPLTGTEQAVVAAASGIVTFGDENVAEGMKVRQGDRLFLIESSGMADDNMQVRFAAARSEYELALSEYKRKESLAAERIVSESELLQAKAELEQKEAVFKSLENNFRDGRQTVTSPMSGFITEINCGNGHYVEAGTVLAHVSQCREMQVVAEVQPKYYSSLSDIDDIMIKPMGTDISVSMKEQGGRVVSYGMAASDERPLLPVTFTIKMLSGIVPGAFVDVHIRCKGEREMLTVPVGAVVEEMGSYSVYVNVEPEHFEKRQVMTGVTDGRMIEIRSGLEEGERIVTRGAVLVKLAAAGGKLDAHAGHVH